MVEAIFAEIDHLGNPPFILVGDLNANTDDIPAIEIALQSGRLMDIGQHAERFGQPAAEPTCFVTPVSDGTRRDYVLASPELFACFTEFRVDRIVEVPVHAVLHFRLAIPFADQPK